MQDRIQDNLRISRVGKKQKIINCFPERDFFVLVIVDADHQCPACPQFPAFFVFM